MKITAIKTFIVDGGFRPWTFVKVETNEPDLVGWGDCTDWGSPGPVVATVERYSEWVIGRDPMQVEAIWWDLVSASARHQGGIAWKAMSGIDSALWDIRGKVLGAPVWQLLGGKLRDELRLYWSHCGTNRNRSWQRLGLPKVETVDELRALATEVGERGYTALKTNLFTLKDRPDATAIRNAYTTHVGDAAPAVLRNAELIVSTFREILGPDVGIALDVAFTFKLGGAIKLAQALEPYNLMWLETETFDAPALHLIRESTKTTICTGESLYGQHGYRPFLEAHAQAHSQTLADGGLSGPHHAHQRHGAVQAHAPSHTGKRRRAKGLGHESTQHCKIYQPDRGLSRHDERRTRGRRQYAGRLWPRPGGICRPY